MSGQNDQLPAFNGVEVRLDVPIKRGDSAIDLVRLRRPSPIDLMGTSLRDLYAMDTQAILTVLPRISIPPLIDQELTALDTADFVALAAEVSGFLLSSSVLARPPAQ